jgi:Glycosyl transferase family 2
VDKQTFVAIPVRDEAERIGPCLLALNQQVRRPDGVLLLLNNCADRTEAIARGLQPVLRFRLDVVSRALPPAEANAGCARRLAMAMAAGQVGRDGVLLTTDADSVAPSDWVSASLAALDRGADIVCGRAVIDPLEAMLIPAHLHADDARECRLIALLDELAWALDPEIHDPLPRHTEASGASLAVRAEAFRRVGGIPAVPSGEDRAFVRALWMTDARVRHDPAIRVVVSGRIEGRAPGGMADTIRRRMTRQDEFTDHQAEPAMDAFRRYSLRQRLRRAWSGPTDPERADPERADPERADPERADPELTDPELAADLAVPQAVLARVLANRFFGSAWSAAEAASQVLRRRRVRFTDAAREIATAQVLLSRFAAPETLAAD